MAGDFATAAGLIHSGWERVQDALLRAPSQEHLIIHWFCTPCDSSTHSDPHWHENRRTEKFVRVVIPTLAAQLQASMLTVSVPWDVEQESATLVLIAALRDRPATIDARPITRSALADAPPYWKLAQATVEPPARLTEIVAGVVL